jgi:superfamily II DNA helicase RecQ
VQKDVIAHLRLARPLVVNTSFDRGNLFYAGAAVSSACPLLLSAAETDHLCVVRHQTTVERDLTRELIGANHLWFCAVVQHVLCASAGKHPCIVYCMRKTDTESIAAHLVKLGIKFASSCSCSERCMVAAHPPCRAELELTTLG